MQQEKLFKCLVTLPFLHKKKSIAYLYQKELLGCFSEDIKIGQSHNLLNWHTSNRLLFNIYVDSMIELPMLILWYLEYTTVVKIKENEETTFKIAALGLQSLCDNGPFYNNSQ